MISNKGYTELKSLGEFGLIEHLTKEIKCINSSTLVGVGDDAAVLDYSTKRVLLSTDMLVQGIHFDLLYTPLKHLGYKSVSVNVSDVCAMNGVSKQITISMAISSHFSVEMLEQFYEGVYAACADYGVDLVGGDTTASSSGLIISVTVIGEVDKDDVVYRSGAKSNDLICLSGNLGAAYMGLQLLEREKTLLHGLDDEAKPEFDGYEYILERFLKPNARVDIVDILRAKGIKPTSMIDVSDGLASDLLHICKASGVGCNIYEAKIPVDYQTYKMAEELNMNSTVCALSGGEDYELLFTAPLDFYDKLILIEDISIIGHIVDKSKGAIMTTRDGCEFEITAQGWSHF